MNYRPSSFSHLPDVVKNLLILNALFFLATITLDGMGFDMYKYFGLHQFQSTNFKPHQLVTHIFMHGNLTHLFFNMFALWMFGKVLENVWGGKRFLIYYMITGLGAAAIHLGVSQYEIMSLQSKISANEYSMIINEGGSIIDGGRNYTHHLLGKLNSLIHIPTVGASGAVFGVLLAFGMLFPNALLYIYFAFPIKAKYFVIMYGLLELYAGISNNPDDNVAHFAHLGGMIFGYFLIKYWRNSSDTFF